MKTEEKKADIPLHRHSQSIIYHPECERCILNAAADKLLEACIGAEIRLRDIAETHGITSRATRALLKAAIAKAKGEAS